jgi:hypothetical protein
MNVTNPLGSDEIEKYSEAEVRRNTRERDQVERGDLKVSAEELAALLRRLSDASTREIEDLINQRIQGDIAGYTELSQQVTQLTSIIGDSVSKLPPK